ncbi:MAG TPA: ribonuclease Y [Candidatus Tyrphobacter sp.]|nr:ribonuclease Y [Candidatus Tyrphobacter sp.]
MNQILVAVLALGAGGVAGYLARQSMAAKKSGLLERQGEETLKKAKDEAQDIVLEAKDKALAVLDEAKKEEKNRRLEIEKNENRLFQREEDLSRRDKELEKRRTETELKSQSLEKAEEEVRAKREQAVKELSEIAGITPEEARKKLFSEVEEKYRDDLAQTVRKIFHEREEEIEKKSLEVITSAIQRYARSHISEITTSTFTLPSEDFKGKIIGREGRNIRTLERLSGVELIVDESPDTIIISSFDPMRREIARLSLEKLVKDGRIQPAKIEEKVEEAKAEIDKRIGEIGEAAVYELNVYDFPKEIVQLLGRLHFRTSFGQNVLAHSVEVAHLAGILASELGANVEIAKRGALVHDIGKAIDHDVEGTHVELGRKILKKYGVSDEIIKAMESHHDDYPYASPEAYIVAAADALSAARPGARRGTLENYIKRLGDLETIAKSFEGVKEAFAVQAGRELRIFVLPEKIDDFRALQLARDVAGKIESEIKYPGEIKVNVIREVRAVEYAR